MNKKDIGIVGLGRMGSRIGLRLKDQGYQVTGFDISEENRQKTESSGLMTAQSLGRLCEVLTPPRIIIISVPAGKAVDDTIDGLMVHIKENDILLECGNSFYKDSIKRGKKLKQAGVHFMDVGTSGGVSGARNGPCLTIGGDKELFLKIEPLFRDLALQNGYLHAGPVGCGHLVKVIHNGIEYGILQAIGEGLNILKRMADQENYPLDLKKICDVWSHGSIIESRLMRDAIHAMEILAAHGDSIEGTIGGGETGTWAMSIAESCQAPAPVLQAALDFRKKTQETPDDIGKIISVIRKVFGEHDLQTRE